MSNLKNNNKKSNYFVCIKNCIFKISNRSIFFFMLLAFLIVCLMYASNISTIPDNVILFYGENLDLKTMFGLSLEETYSSEPRPYFYKP